MPNAKPRQKARSIKRNPISEWDATQMSAVLRDQWGNIPRAAKLADQLLEADTDAKRDKVATQVEKFLVSMSADPEELAAILGITEGPSGEPSVEDINRALIAGTLGVGESGRVRPLPGATPRRAETPHAIEIRERRERRRGRAALRGEPHEDPRVTYAVQQYTELQIGARDWPSYTPQFAFILGYRDVLSRLPEIYQIAADRLPPTLLGERTMIGFLPANITEVMEHEYQAGLEQAHTDLGAAVPAVAGYWPMADRARYVEPPFPVPRQPTVEDRPTHWLIVKGDEADAREAADRWGVRVFGILGNIGTGGGDTGLYATPRDGERSLNEWMNETSDAPYPPGALLYWRPMDAELEARYHQNARLVVDDETARARQRQPRPPFIWSGENVRVLERLLGYHNDRVDAGHRVVMDSMYSILVNARTMEEVGRYVVNRDEVRVYSDNDDVRFALDRNAPDVQREMQEDRHFQEASNAAATRDIIQGMANAIWWTSWADAMEQAGRSRELSGRNVAEIAPETPQRALAYGEALYEAINDATRATRQRVAAATRAGHQATAADPVLNEWQRITNVEVRADDPVNFGYYLAMESLGHGVAWTDDHEAHNLTTPNIEATLYDPDDGAHLDVTGLEGRGVR